MATTDFPDGITSFGRSITGSGELGSPFGSTLYVDTVNGSNGNDGRSATAAFRTMQTALTAAADHDTIFFVGKVREQLVAPLGISGVKIVGGSGGNARNDDGAWWTTPASGAVAGKALIEIREQGWEFHNFMMTPDATGGACIKAHRAESATYPDSSHFICRGMRFVGAGDSVTGTPIGVEDVGGNHHYVIDNCEFQYLANAIYLSSAGIATPLRDKITRNSFYGCTNDVNTAMSYGLVEGNRFFTDSTITVKTASGGNTIVIGNLFPNVAADIDPAHGYDGNATDVWSNNYVTDTAGPFGDPA